MEFVSKPRIDQDPITFTLDGDEYKILPGKKGGAVVALMDSKTHRGSETAKLLMDWLGGRLNAYDRKVAKVEWTGELGPQASRLAATLRDEDSALELETVIDAINGLIGAIAARPTGSQSG